jgi:gamma-glutamyltranspeptidase/glutathione hydrolase
MGRLLSRILTIHLIILMVTTFAFSQRTEKPVLHGKEWVAITGKPLAATAGALVFAKGGNAVDAACSMLAATCTMFDVLSWGGETQALIYNPKTGKVIGINALGVAPTGATAEFFLNKDLHYPPQFGPLAAVTPGTPGGLLVMLAEYGKLSLAEVLAPTIALAKGYPMEAQTARLIEGYKWKIKEWPYSKRILLPNLGEEWEAPKPGEIFRQPELVKTLEALVAAESKALQAGKSRKEAIMAAYDLFYKGDIAKEFVRASQEMGGLHTMEDLANWQVYIEEPVMTTYKGIEVYKLTSWVQGPVMLQALNMLENFDLKSMGYNSARYIHTLYQVMNLSFADRDFYYGDPYFPPEEPMAGLLSKDYAKERIKLIDTQKNDYEAAPGDPYKFQEGDNPYLELLKNWGDWEKSRGNTFNQDEANLRVNDSWREEFHRGTTSIQAADKEGWVVSITPSGGWIPACIAGETGIGMSQRMQSFVLRPEENPYNVVEPGKRPRATLTPGIALKDGKPYLSFAVQGGDTQDQNLIQFFLNMVEFDMNVQQAVEAANIVSYQMYSSFGTHRKRAGNLTLREDFSPWIISQLRDMDYKISTSSHTSGPINAIFFDWEHGTFWGGASNYGEDYGIAW